VPTTIARIVPPVAATALATIESVAFVGAASKKPVSSARPKIFRKLSSVHVSGTQCTPSIGCHSSCGLNAIVTIQ